jgi:site-specific recombinase XerC
VYLADAISCFVLIAQGERRLASRTVQLYKRALTALEDYATSANRQRLEDLTPNLLRAAAAAQMTGQSHADNWRGGEVMAGAVIAATRTMIRRLHEEYPDLNLPDLSMVKAPKVPERIQARLQDGEFARLEAALRMRLLRERVPRFLVVRDMAILELLANTGLRAAECCGLDVEDLNLREATVRVRQAKGGNWRVLTVRDPDEPHDGGEVVRAMADYLRYRERTFGLVQTPALWLTLQGNRLNPHGLRRALSTLCAEAGLDGSRPPHAFRRSHFSGQYAERPTNLPVLVERMGWTSGTMIRVYTRGVNVELARRIPLPLSSKKWREDASATISKPRVGDKAGSLGGGGAGMGQNVRSRTERPDPASPVKRGLESGRLPSSRNASRHLTS